MTGAPPLSGEVLAQLAALAARLEGEGHYGAAKLVRASVEAMITRAAHAWARKREAGGLAADLEDGVALVRQADLEPELEDALRLASSAVAEGRLLSFAEVGNVYVCRTCGRVTVGGEPAACPACGAHPLTLKPIPANYWFDALDSVAVVRQMERTPEIVGEAIAGLSEDDFLRPAPDGGWSLRNIITHLRDAQDVLAQRARLILDQDNPQLESLAVFAWATQEGDRPPATHDIFAAYRASRAATAALLGQIGLEDWRRTGQHSEFGVVTLLQQASYFTTHELTHLPQIVALAGAHGM